MPVGSSGSSSRLSGVMLRTLPYAMASRGTASWARPTQSVSLSALEKNLLTVRLARSASLLLDDLLILCVAVPALWPVIMRLAGFLEDVLSTACFFCPALSVVQEWLESSDASADTASTAVLFSERLACLLQDVRTT